MINYTVFLAVYFLLDALHDSSILRARPRVESKYDETAWHIEDAIIKALVGVVLAKVMFNIQDWDYLYFAGFIACFRGWWFNLTLNMFRKLKWNHLGKAIPEGWFLKVPWLYWVICVSGSIVLFLKLWL